MAQAQNAQCSLGLPRRASRLEEAQGKRSPHGMAAAQRIACRAGGTVVWRMLPVMLSLAGLRPLCIKVLGLLTLVTRPSLQWAAQVLEQRYSQYRLLGLVV